MLDNARLGCALLKGNGTMPRYKRKRPRVETPVPSAVYTITTFCKAHELSEPYYRQLRKKGLGPREMRLGRKVLISQEAAADWRRMKEATP